MSKSSIVNDMANLAVTTIGKDKLPEVLSAFKDDKINTATRISFKVRAYSNYFGSCSDKYYCYFIHFCFAKTVLIQKWNTQLK